MCVRMCVFVECFTCAVAGGTSGATWAPALLKDHFKHRARIALEAIWDRVRPLSVDSHCQNNPKNNEHLAIIRGQDINRMEGSPYKSEEDWAVHHIQNRHSYMALWIWGRSPSVGDLPISGRT